MTRQQPAANNLWRNLVEFQVRFRIPILVLIVLATAFFSWQVFTRLRIATDFFDLYPPRHPYIKLYKQYRKMFGSANVLTVILEVKHGDIYTVETIAKLDRLTKALLHMKGVNPLQVISLTHPRLKQVGVGEFGVHVSPVVWPRLPETQEDLDKLKSVVYENEGIRGLFVSANDKAALIHAGFWEEGVDLKQLFAEIKNLQAQEEDPNHAIHVTGYPMLYAWIAHYGKQMYMVFIATALVMFLLLLFYFRTAIAAIVPLVSGLMSAVWGLGLPALIGTSVDPLILVVPLLLSARALSHSVQALERYHEECARDQTKGEAILAAFSSLYKPSILSIVTDGLGVLTIAVCTIPLMQKLAFASSFWVVSIYVSVVLLNPILFSFLPRPRRSTAVTDGSSVGIQRIYLWACRRLFSLSTSWRRWVVLGCIAFLLCAGGYYSAQIKVGDTSAGKAVLYGDHPYNLAADKLNRDFVGSSQLVVIAEGLKEGTFKDPEPLMALDDLATYVLGLPHVGGTVTVTDIIKRVFRMFHEGDPKWAMLPDEPSHLAQTLFLFEANMAAGEMDRFVSLPDYKNATITIFVREYDNATIRNLIETIKTYTEKHPQDKVLFRLAGGIIGILAAVNEEVEWSYWVNMGTIFGITFLLCAWSFRSFLAALVLLIPLAISQILSDAFMLLKGIDLNINSLPVAAVGVGVGVDYGIYVLSRMSELYAAERSFETACYEAITTTGKAVLFTATTLVAGVIFWAFSNIKFQAEMGLLLAFLMFFNMLGSLVFVPALVSTMGPERLLRNYRV